MKKTAQQVTANATGFECTNPQACMPEHCSMQEAKLLHGT